MTTAIHIPCPCGFRFAATAEILRRGPADPLTWFDGSRWRRLFDVDSSVFLLQASWAAGQGGLAVRRLAGSAPSGVAARLITRIFGLDDPGQAFARRILMPVRRLIWRHAGTLLPGSPTLFEALVQTVLGQQLHAGVAHQQRAALIRAFGIQHEVRGWAYWAFPRSMTLADVRPERIRRLGISGAKARAVVAIARSTAEGRLSEDRLTALPVTDAIGELTALPGVGRWTSEWVLLRALRRFEVVPAGDLAVRKAVTWALGFPELLTEQRVREAAAVWFPYGGLVIHRLLAAHRRPIE